MSPLHRRLILLAIGMLLFGILPAPTPAQESPTLPLAEMGPYGVIGKQTFSFSDPTRDNRVVSGYIWYPSEQKENASRIRERPDADPDPAAAPYPLIIYSHPRGQDGITAATTLGAAQHLASYGYAVLSIEHNDAQWGLKSWLYRPMDILFILDQLPTSRNENPLVGLIDFEHIGITGYSLGGVTTLLFSGARFDLQSREAYCTNTADPGPRLCDEDSAAWAEFLAERERYDPPLVAGEPWPPYAHEHILAALPVAPCHGPLFGENGLASATLPTLIIGLAEDEVCWYERDAAYIYEHLGSEDRALITLFEMGHVDAIFDKESQNVFNHFTLAFFGYHLRGQTDYAQYLSAEFVSAFANLEWAAPGE